LRCILIIRDRLGFWMFLVFFRFGCNSEIRITFLGDLVSTSGASPEGFLGMWLQSTYVYIKSTVPLPPPLSPASVPHPPPSRNRRGEGTLGGVGGVPIPTTGEKTLALCQLCGCDCPSGCWFWFCVLIPVGLVWVRGLGGVSSHDVDYPPFFSPSFALYLPFKKQNDYINEKKIKSYKYSTSRKRARVVFSFNWFYCP
jgi:hypothetical protein